MKYKLPFIETKTKISGYLKKEKEKKEKALSRKRELWIKGIFYDWFFKPISTYPSIFITMLILSTIFLFIQNCGNKPSTRFVC